MGAKVMPRIRPAHASRGGRGGFQRAEIQDLFDGVPAQTGIKQSNRIAPPLFAISR
jgi:hypothetical protein